MRPAIRESNDASALNQSGRFTYLQTSDHLKPSALSRAALLRDRSFICSENIGAGLSSNPCLCGS
ncbi:hypothetical protein, partial [Paraburkholderia sp. SIMBA_030]|uniref:hypothetical protein n=1 Tax=Paraburkholderia sp. SIMBA_030 TaxID=3085773 RepID=UPI00397BA976